MYVQTLEKFEDERGGLFPLGFDRLPFVPKRLFVVSDVPKGIKRGDHAHYVTEQFLICLEGEIEVLLDDGKKEVRVSLLPMQGVHVPAKVWDSQVFKTGKDILLVLASTDYDREDYIESLSLFKDLFDER